MRLIGIAGRMGAGKTTLAQALCALHGQKKISFATPLKEIAKLMGWDGVKDGPGRRLLQKLGAVGREYRSNLWIDMLDESLDHFTDDVVIDDVRFENEVDYVLNHGGMILWVENGEGSITSDGDVSERMMPEDVIGRCSVPAGQFAIIRNVGSPADMLRSASQAIADASRYVNLA